MNLEALRLARSWLQAVLAASLVAALPLPSRALEARYGTVPTCLGCPQGSCGLCDVVIPSIFECPHPERTHSVQGAIEGTALNPKACSVGGVRGDFSKEVAGNTYGVQNSFTFFTSGSISYSYRVPFTLEFELPGCVGKGAPVRMKNPRIQWGQPVLTASDALSFGTNIYFNADVPLDGLDATTLSLTQLPDHMRLVGSVPVLPGWSESFLLNLTEPPFDDGTLGYWGISGTLGGQASAAGSGPTHVVVARTLEADGENMILVQTDGATTPRLWAATADQVDLAGHILQATPATLAGDALLVLHAAGLNLNANVDLGITRRDRAVLYRVQFPTSVGVVDPSVPVGDTTVTFSMPVSYHATLDSQFDYPVSLSVDLDGPGDFDKFGLVSVSTGANVDASMYDVRRNFMQLLFGIECVPDVFFEDVQVVPVTVPVHVVDWVALLEDRDGDGVGDEPDGDLDGVVDAADNCPTVVNVDQLASDADALGDACDPDDDNDGVPDLTDGGAPWDKCPVTPDPDQADLDADGIGDACDADVDGDGVEDGADNCRLAPNTAQENADRDGAGDACDEDDDEDWVLDGADNCPFVPNPRQSDADGDGTGDACDADVDGDGVLGATDNCPLAANADQLDFDADGAGDACDPDVDGDAVQDGVDGCLLTPLATVVDAAGCSMAQLCPCSSPRATKAPWGNHGRYVSCVSHVAEVFLGAGLISPAEKDATVSSGAQSGCGGRR